jgi:hypothetical protein
LLVAADKKVVETGNSRVEMAGFDSHNIEDNSVGVTDCRVEGAEEAEEAEKAEKAERGSDIGIDVGNRGQTGVVAPDVEGEKAGLEPEADIEIDVG